MNERQLRDYRAALKEAALCFGVKSYSALAPYVEPFVAVNFSRYCHAGLKTPADKATQIAKVLRILIDAKKEAFLSTAKSHGTLKKIEILSRLRQDKSGAARRAHLMAFVEPIIAAAKPTDLSILMKNLGTDTWCFVFQFGNAQFEWKLQAHQDARTGRVTLFLLERSQEKAWRLTVMGSWAHQTWMLVLSRFIPDLRNFNAPREWKARTVDVEATQLPTPKEKA